MSRKPTISMLKGACMCALVAVVIATTGALALGQNAFDTGTPAESKGGTALLSSFAQDKIETVNLANGNLNVHIPLVTIGGRGSASFTLALSYNSKLWTGEQAFDSLGDITVSGATYDDLMMRLENTIAIGSGWFILRGPAIKARTVQIDWKKRPECPGGQGDGPEKVLTKCWLVLPDGSEVELRDRATQGEPHTTAVYPNCTPNNTDADRGRIWYSTDGSAITYVTDAPNGVVLGQLAGYVFLSDGTRMRTRNGGSCSDIIDRNGNYLHINYSSPVNGVTYTDPLGREVILQANPGGAGTGATITITGYNGVAPRVITIDAGTLAPADNSQAAPNLRSEFQNTSLWPRPFYNGDTIDFWLYSHSPASAYGPLSRFGRLVSYGSRGGPPKRCYSVELAGWPQLSISLQPLWRTRRDCLSRRWHIPNRLRSIRDEPLRPIGVSETGA